VERFSIGWGPKIKSWYGKDGVEYCLCWLPIGGYVVIPQLADMSAIEGESKADVKAMPPLSFSTKIIVSGAGAVMNILFAFALACVVWIAGLPQSNEMSTTRIGYVVPTSELSDGSKVTSPASKAGLKAGDIVRAIDGVQVREWYDLTYTLMTSSGRTPDGRPKSVFTIERDGRIQDIILYPQLTGAERDRRVGISPAYELIVHSVSPDSIAANAGFKADDILASIDGTDLLNVATYQELVDRHAREGFSVHVRRGSQELDLRLSHVVEPKTGYGFTFKTGSHIVHPSPVTQLWENITMTFRTIGSLINPQSDIGLSKVAGPVGIVRIFHNAASAGFMPIVMFTILVNVSLAIFNLLPIPVLDGGHIIFAIYAKLRGKALPLNFVMATQGLFMMLLLTMIVYVSFFDVRRLYQDAKADHAAPVATPATAPAK
jgi:regulator of sigma E protease